MNADPFASDEIEVITQHPLEFLNMLMLGEQGFFELAYLWPDKLPNPDRNRRIVIESYALGQEQPDWDRVAELNSIGYGISFGPLPRNKRVGNWSQDDQGKWHQDRGKEVDVDRAQVLWSDIDLKSSPYRDKAEAYQAALDFPIPPTVIVDSGGGYHLYWLLDPLEVTPESTIALKETMRGIAVDLHADQQVAKLSTIMRLPGSINTKPDRGGHLVTVIDAIPGATYRLEDFKDWRALAAPVAAPLEREIPFIHLEHTPNYVTRYQGANHAEGTRNDSLFKVAWAMFNDNFAEQEVLSALTDRARADGLADNEIAATIRSAHNAPRGDPTWLSRTTRSRARVGNAIKKLRGIRE